ncbi:hypothetical protein RFN28_31890 [Mesorhizobium sp. VK24D]|uniref:Uncharacterized protein n=1 Tax=Mesorhizobium album TaxID=3072314 RepID=A0ABU4Y7X2_9HYPH|nr:hypothetical protein [Mesorhizobium sp. VK24D]MDX8483027.1 hypothetical protein [Mesorhizobium sp. VK24D]
MALDILTQDIIVDEPSGRTHGHVDPSAGPHSATLQHLLSREGLGGLTAPRPASCTPHSVIIIGNRDCETGTPRRNRR